MRIRLGIVLFFIAMIFIAGQSRADIELPFDYFYGRWVPTHSVSGQLELQDYDETQKEITYRFTGDRYRFGLSMVPKARVNPYFPGSGVYPRGLIQTRPRSNWQIGIDDVYYSEWSTESVPSPDRVTGLSIDRKASIQVSSKWLNKETVVVAERHGAFTNSDRPLLQAGCWSLENTIRAYHEKDTREFFYSSGSNSLSSTGAHHSDDWMYLASSMNSMRLGMTDDMTAQVDMNLDYWVRRDRSLRWGDDPDNPGYQSLSKEFWRHIRPYYRVLITSGYLTPWYFDASLKQYFGYQLHKREFYRVRTGDDSLYQPESWWTKNFELRTTSFMLGAHFVSEGEFDPEIILDDYSGYYRRMLFHRQVRAGLVFNGSGSRGYKPDGLERASLTVSCAAGLYNHWQVGLRAEYSWRKYWGFSEPMRGITLRPQVAIAFRSYSYERGTGPGWDRDSQYDIVFGPLLRLGQMYATLSFLPPTLVRYTREEVPFLSVSGMASDSRAQVTLHVEAGLGRGFEIEVEDREEYFHSEIQRRTMTAGMVWRFLPYAEAKASYLQHYNHGETDEPTITVEGRVLF
ncbi:MAG: hypothetical protein KOO62_09420 [candidate division Zixibacteria bacterium]|nr:hypothetical protein [candidate division Zixibacteria bacterium]